jgi:hypothetical protein
MASDPRTIAVEAIFLLLADRLPGILATRDALRFATKRLRLGPYTIPASASLVVNGETFSLTAGSRTAAQVATELAGAVSFAAAAETDGSGSRLKLTHGTAPAREVPSILRFAGDEATLDALGLRAGGPSDVAEDAIASPAVTLAETEPGEITQIDRPLVYCADVMSAPHRNGQVRQRIHEVKIQLEGWIPGSFSLPLAATLGRALELERGIAAALRVGDSRGAYYAGGTTAGARVIQAKPADLAVRTQVFQFRTGGTTIPVAVIRPVIDALIYSPET